MVPSKIAEDFMDGKEPHEEILAEIGAQRNSDDNYQKAALLLWTSALMRKDGLEHLEVSGKVDGKRALF